jgi:hypothetical protein
VNFAYLIDDMVELGNVKHKIKTDLMKILNIRDRKLKQIKMTEDEATEKGIKIYPSHERTFLCIKKKIPTFAELH